MLVLVSCAAGCADGPAERYTKAVEAMAALRDAPKEEKAKAADDMLHFFSAKSADVLRGVFAAAERSSRWEWIKLDKLLMDGDVKEVKEDGEMLLLTVEDPNGKSMEVRMVNEGGLWVIDGLALKRFWAPLKEAF